MSNDRILRTKEAAEKLGLQPCTLEKWRITGEGPQFVRLGRAIGYRELDLEAFAAKRLCKSTSEASVK